MVNSDYQLMVHDYPYYIQKSSHATIIYQSWTTINLNLLKEPPKNAKIKHLPYRFPSGIFQWKKIQ
jgi:hypothetical protein